VSLRQSRRDKSAFARTQIAKFLSSLLLCNLVQAIGGLLNVAWLVEHRVYVGVTCTAQGALKQIGNVRAPFPYCTEKSEYSHLLWSQTGPAIFTFLIAVQTFCLLVLRREWSSRTCHITHIISWAFLLLELCIEHFVYADPENGPYYGITTSGYWCWISPKYLIERYTTDYLFMTTSAAFCFILYSLVFFRLRGNISIQGYKIFFHRRSSIRIRRTSDGASIFTDDPRVPSYLDTIAKHMLWYPIVYTFLILPVAASRLSTFHGKPVPFAATVLTAAVFMLHGFFNTVLFCTTRKILPGSWRQRFGLCTSGRDDTSRSNATTTTCQFTVASTTTVGTGPRPAVLSVNVDDVGIKYATERSSSFVGSCSPSSSTSPTLPTLPFQAHVRSGQRANAHEHYIRLSSSARGDTRTRTHSEIDEGDKDSDLSIAIHLASMAKPDGLEAPQHPGRASSDHGGGVDGPDRV